MRDLLQELGIPREKVFFISADNDIILINDDFLGNIVLDPFVRSGTTLVATRLLKRRTVGIDISKKYCEIAKERLIKEAKANMGSLV